MIEYDELFNPVVIDEETHDPEPEWNASKEQWYQECTETVGPVELVELLEGDPWPEHWSFNMMQLEALEYLATNYGIYLS